MNFYRNLLAGIVILTVPVAPIFTLRSILDTVAEIHQRKYSKSLSSSKLFQLYKI